MFEIKISHEGSFQARRPPVYGRRCDLTFSTPANAAPRLGVLHDNRVIDVEKAIAGLWNGPLPVNLLQVIESDSDGWRRLADTLAQRLATHSVIDTSRAHQEVRWHAPIPRPAKNIFCVGLNYLSHMEESARARSPRETSRRPCFFSPRLRQR